MLETKSLLCTNGTHSGSVTCGIDNKELKELYISFFKYMSDKGWKEYLDNTYLTKIINKFSKSFKSMQSFFHHTTHPLS